MKVGTATDISLMKLKECSIWWVLPDNSQAYFAGGAVVTWVISVFSPNTVFLADRQTDSLLLFVSNVLFL